MTDTYKWIHLEPGNARRGFNQVLYADSQNIQGISNVCVDNRNKRKGLETYNPKR